VPQSAMRLERYWMNSLPAALAAAKEEEEEEEKQ
jgi:hypothetical protein